MRTSFLSFLGLSSIIALLTAGCSGAAASGNSTSGSSGASTDGFPPSPGGVGTTGGDTGSVADGAPGGSVGVPTPTPTPKPQPLPAGTLTAGDWDDNLNFSLFRDYITGYKKEQQQVAGIESEDRVVIKVTTDDGKPVSNALVKIADSAQSYLSAPTATDGRVLFFPTHDGSPANSAVTITITPPAGQGSVQTVTTAPPASGSDWEIKLPGAKQELPTGLDLAFVIDATGSMTDELNYLKAEVQGIADSVKAKFGNTSIQYSLIVYRDQGDAYVTRRFDFTSDINAFKGDLNMQFADGGGDTPEAMDKALALVPDLSWRGGNVARVAFLIADAPPHAKDMAATFKEIDKLRPLGVKLYPVAASGVDVDAEYVMRVGAEATLGRYLFLTDDSGVGDPHAEPHIPCYQVEKLNLLINRVIASELTATRVPVAPADVIRSVGDPQAGICTLPNGEKAYL